MDEIERALAEERDEEQRRAREGARRARRAGDVLGTVVIVAFLGGASYLAWSLFSDRVPAWMCLAIAGLTIVITVVRAVVRRAVRGVSDRW